jgi:putative RNA 2'-phosphotransferase
MDTVDFLNRLLRDSQPGSGLALDRRGWVDISALLTAVARTGHPIDRRGLHRLVQKNQTCFAISRDGSRIRALRLRGREAADPPAIEDAPPGVLYHGTAAHLLEFIACEGLVPGTRKYVHLHVSPRLAMEAGALHGEAELLAVRVALMLAERFLFYRAEEGVWLVKAVPAEFLVRW